MANTKKELLKQLEYQQDRLYNAEQELEYARNELHLVEFNIASIKVEIGKTYVLAKIKKNRK